MPPKSRDNYTTEWSNRDFNWFSKSPAPADPPPEIIDLSPDNASPPTTTPTPRKARPRQRSLSRSRSSSSLLRPGPPRRVRKPPSALTLSKPRRTGGANMAPITEEPPTIVLQPPASDTSPPPSTKKPGPWSEWFPTLDSPPRFWRARRLPDDSWSYQHSSTLPPPRKPPPPPPQRNLVASFFFGFPVVPGPSPPQGSRNPSPRPRPPPPPREEDSDDDEGSDHLRVIPAARSSGTTFPSSAVSTGKGKGSSLVSVVSKVSAEGGKVEVAEGGDGGKPVVGVGGGGGGGGGGEKGKKAAAGPQAGAMTLFLMGSRPAAPKKQGVVPVAPAVGGGGGSGNGKKLDKKVKGEKELRVDAKKRVRSWLRDVAACERPEMAEWDGDGLPIY